VKIFTLKKADATLTGTLLQNMFFGGQQRAGGGGGLGGGLNQGGFGGFNQGGLGANSNTTLRPVLTLTGSPSDGANLIELRINVDDRTNSLIVAGSQNDLDAIQAIIARLEDSTVSNRTQHILKMHNASAVDVATALQPFLQQSLQVITTGNQLTNYQGLQKTIVIAAEPVTNNLLIDATEEAYIKLLPVIQKLDAQPLQVQVEVLIAEVILDNSEEFGVEIGLQTPLAFQRSVIPSQASVPGNNTGPTFSNSTAAIVPPGVSVNSTIGYYAGQAFNFNNTNQLAWNNLIGQGLVAYQGLTNYGVGRASQNGVGGFVFSAGSDTVNVLVRALKTQGRIDNWTRPTLTVLDNQFATVNIGGLYPYVNGGQFTNFGTFQPSIAQQLIGTTLNVSPRINPDGRVLMRVEPSIIAPQDTLVSLGNGQFATAFSQQSVQTTVSVNDGETIVLGGLITKTNQRQENKVPWLGDLPYLGTLFRFRTQTQQRRELLVIMTPHIIRNSADSERRLMEEARKMSWTLRDLDKLTPSSPLTSEMNDPNRVLPPDVYAQPHGGSPLEPTMRLPDPKPTPAPEVPSLPGTPAPIPPIPEVPGTSAKPKPNIGPVIQSSAADGIIAPGDNKPRTR
jgi:type II secretory pathway component GspD/PulD (secretin)